MIARGLLKTTLLILTIPSVSAAMEFGPGEAAGGSQRGQICRSGRRNRSHQQLDLPGRTGVEGIVEPRRSGPKHRRSREAVVAVGQVEERGRDGGAEIA